MGIEIKLENSKTASKKRDPFEPTQPAIPGVPAQSAEKKKPAAQPPPGASLQRMGASGTAQGPNKLVAIVGGLGICALLAGLIVYTKMQQPSANTAAATAIPDAPGATAESENAAKPQEMPVGPGVIAKADDLTTAWSSKKFLYNDPISKTKIPAMVVRLPRGGYWGFSLKDPFGSCDLELESDLQKLRDVYGYGTDHPMVVEPCNKSVYDLLQYGGASNAEVRGLPVHGVGLRPPIAIEIEQQGNEVRAGRIE